MDVSIIIVNYKTPQLVIRCVESIYATLKDDIDFEIIVVDNDSGDGSEGIVKERFGRINWINNEENEGFGRANNIGILASGGKYVLLINSDVIVLENSITACLAEMEQNQSIGVLGCTLLNEDGSIQGFTSTVASYRKILDLNLIYNYFIQPKNMPVKAIMGSFMLMPKSTLEDCGLFDPDFFMYSEEIELCHRITKKGYQLKFLKDIHVIHKNGGSTPDRSWANKQSYLSSALLFYKIRGFFGYKLYHFLMLTNLLTNFIAMWFLDKKYRADYWKTTGYYFSGFEVYMKIPFCYSRGMGTGKRLLKLTK